MADIKTPAEAKKKRARSVINNALRDGRIKKPQTCAKCHKQTSKLTAHHKGRYVASSTEVKRQNIVWLCYHCHKLETDKSHRVK